MALQQIDYNKLFVDVPVALREELIKYYEAIKLLSESQANVQFKNEGENHAAAVMSILFSSSHESIKIFAGNFGGNVCDKFVYRKSLEDTMLQNSHKTLEVIFEKEPNRQSQGFALLLKLKALYPARVTIKQANSSQIKKYRSQTHNGEIVHFALGDKFIYRYEVDTASFKAFCDFNDPVFSLSLSNLFILLSADASLIN